MSITEKTIDEGVLNIEKIMKMRVEIKWKLV